MAGWDETPPTFDRESEAWGSTASAWAEDDEGGAGEQYLELIGTELWVAGTVDLGRFRRVSDFVNIVQGYLLMRNAVVLTHAGEATRLTLPELRVLPDDVAVVGQPEADRPTSAGEGGKVIERTRQRLVVFTRSHLIDGDVYIHGDGSIMAFVDATDPRFIPMTDVRVRWLADQKLATRYPFALLQRSQILGVATEGIKLGGADSTERRTATLQAQAAQARDEDALAEGSGDAEDEA
ncbi:MAG TPA: hypothetical protein VK831_04315 [Candidatus Deferrimicrobiaceae bacterium]|nr:hypothetical protein [Candidatus Deferrimicrobiaceae bacterium]